MSYRRDELILARHAAVLRSEDPQLAQGFDSLTAKARAAGIAMPDTENRIRPLAAVVLAVVAALILAVAAYAMTRPAACASFSAAVHRPSCQSASQAPAHAGAKQ